MLCLVLTFLLLYSNLLCILIIENSQYLQHEYSPFLYQHKATLMRMGDACKLTYKQKQKQLLIRKKYVCGCIKMYHKIWSSIIDKRTFLAGLTFREDYILGGLTNGGNFVFENELGMTIKTAYNT